MRNTTAHAAALEASYLVPRSVIRDSFTSTKVKAVEFGLRCNLEGSDGPVLHTSRVWSVRLFLCSSSLLTLPAHRFT